MRTVGGGGAGEVGEGGREGGRDRELVCEKTVVSKRHRDCAFASSWRKEGGRERERQRERRVCARKE